MMDKNLEEIIEHILFDISKSLSDKTINTLKQKIEDLKEDIKSREKEKININKEIEDINFILDQIKGNNILLQYVLYERKVTLKEEIDNLNIERQEKRLKEAQKQYEKKLELRRLFDYICEKRDSWL